MPHNAMHCFLVTPIYVQHNTGSLMLILLYKNIKISRLKAEASSPGRPCPTDIDVGFSQQVLKSQFAQPPSG